MNVSIEHPQMGYILHESPNPRLEYNDNNTFITPLKCKAYAIALHLEERTLSMA